MANNFKSDKNLLFSDDMVALHMRSEKIISYKSCSKTRLALATLKPNQKMLANKKVHIDLDKVIVKNTRLKECSFISNVLDFLRKLTSE